MGLVKSRFLTALQAGIKWPMSFFGSTLSNNILSESAFILELKVYGRSGPQTLGAFWAPISDFKPSPLSSALSSSIDVLVSFIIPVTDIAPETEILQLNNMKTAGL